MITTKSRWVRYRRLVLAEIDPEKAKLLFKIADESERGVSFTAEWLTPAIFMREHDRPL